MRIVQLIDSLEAGGAERMAVSYANALAGTIEFSGLVATRKEGGLLDSLNEKASYLYLQKKSAIDFGALLKLRKYVIKNSVEVVHAHGTSFFFSFLLKLIHPSVKIIWHNHYGDSEGLPLAKLISLQIAVPFFSGIIAVNQKLKSWAEDKLLATNVIYLPNFPSQQDGFGEPTLLKGIEGKRIVCLANLRVEKNHFLLLDVAKKLKQSHLEWTFHLAGKNFEDEYSKQIQKRIIELDLQNHVFMYGSKNDVKNILEQSTIAVLTSYFEGMPVALLEYGLHKKAVLTTDVGEIPNMIESGKNGLIVPSGNTELFYENLVKCIDNPELRNEMGMNLHNTIMTSFSEGAIINQYVSWLKLLK